MKNTTMATHEIELENDLEALMLQWFNIKLTTRERKILEQEILRICEVLGL